MENWENYCCVVHGLKCQVISFNRRSYVELYMFLKDLKRNVISSRVPRVAIMVAPLGVSRV